MLQNFEKWFSGSVGTKQNRTERLSQKPEPNHNQMFFEIWNQTQKNWNQSQLYYVYTFYDMLKTIQTHFEVPVR
jgi:hypothetical protein